VVFAAGRAGQVDHRASAPCGPRPTTAEERSVLLTRPDPLGARGELTRTPGLLGVQGCAVGR
jgi:hypothetical protein